jgi:hypothetical protein
VAIAEAFKLPDRTMKALDELRKRILDLEQCVNEAVLYAEQSSYEQLQEMSAKYGKIKGESAIEESTATAEALRITLIELSKPVRRMLGLKKITLKPPKK